MIYVLSEVEDAVRESRVVKLKCGAFVALRGIGITTAYPGYFLVDTGDRVWPEVYFPREIMDSSNEDNNEVVQVLYPVVTPLEIARLQQERDEARVSAEEACKKYNELLELVGEIFNSGDADNDKVRDLVLALRERIRIQALKLGRSQKHD